MDLYLICLNLPNSDYIRYFNPKCPLEKITLDEFEGYCGVDSINFNNELYIYSLDETKNFRQLLEKAGYETEVLRLELED